MNANSSDSANPVHLGSLTYTPHLNHAELRPSLNVLLVVVPFFGGFALMAGCIALFMIAASFNAIFGLELFGITKKGWSPGPPTPLHGVVFLVSSLLPGIFCAVMGGAVLQLLRFWRYPTIFNYSAGVLRRGGNDTCWLREISEIRLRRITDPNYPGKAKVGLLAALRDGSVLSLDPRFSAPFPFLSRLNNQKEDPFTDLGQLRDGPQMEAARRAASDIASRIGVSVNEFIERGSLAPQNAKG